MSIACSFQKTAKLSMRRAHEPATSRTGVNAPSRDMAGQLSQVLELIAHGAPLEEILTAIVELAESRWTDGIAAIMLVEDDQTLRVGAGPRLPFGYVAGIAGLPIALSG